MNEEEFFTTERERMVEEQLAKRDIRDPQVLEAMRAVPRHLFVDPQYREQAYTDGPLPIESGQTISQPYIVALMTQLLGLRGDEKVLEVGTGSGYQAAVLSHLASQVYTIERHPGLARFAERVLLDLGIDNVSVYVGDGSRGLWKFAPYDAIMVTAAAPAIPPILLDQLADGGRLVVPVGERGGQVLERWLRQGDEYIQENLVPVAFVPLRGEFGFQED
jgi:protein-L-isoaspartate(D-aspartate) O-methyltransferase